MKQIANLFSSYGAYIIAAVAIVVIAVLIFLLKKVFSGDKAGIDDLTGLGNKNAARKYFNGLESNFSASVCVGYIAMDAKHFADTFDRNSCDEFQTIVGKYLSSVCDATTYFARVGDGAFLVCMSSTGNYAAQQRIHKLVAALNQKEITFAFESVSPFRAGIFFKANENSSFEDCVGNAVLAYNYACQKELNLYICTDELIKGESYLKNLQEKLSNAIDEKQFDMYFQFIYNTKADGLTCAEVLSRWNNPFEGFLMPASYINDMRRTGVINKFDMYMLNKTCNQLAEWSDGTFGELRLSCNINRVTISNPDFIDNFSAILKKHKFDHSRLMLEITEDALIDKAIAYKNIVFCKNEGIAIAIDDLCAGHSTLQDVSDYPIDQIKLDRQTILSSDTEQGIKLLKELIAMAHRLDLKVVCEGVETESQLNTALDSGCDYVQGYYYSYVLPLEEAKEHYLKSLNH